MKKLLKNIRTWTWFVTMQFDVTFRYFGYPTILLIIYVLSFSQATLCQNTNPTAALGFVAIIMSCCLHWRPSRWEAISHRQPQSTSDSLPASFENISDYCVLHGGSLGTGFANLNSAQ